MTMTRRRVLAATLLLAASTLAARAEAPPASAPGDLWEVTSQMSMEGMPMKFPANKVKVCAAKEWKEPPGAADERRRCTSSDFAMDASGKATWKTTCAGPPPMSGEGELTRQGPDAWSGTIKFATEGGVMTLTLGGKRLSGC
jgi:hypothetical protein